MAIGGGTGLPTVLRCLRDLAAQTTAVVSVADDGGSSGRLRQELGMLPPGDLRKCLVALADPESPLGRIFEYRFAAGEGLAGHTLGNLIMAALVDLEGGFAEGVAAAAGLVGARGQVLPSTLSDVTLYARADDGRTITGQYDIATMPKAVTSVHIEPADAPVYPATAEALTAADLVVIGPGSLYTSILPNLLVCGVPEAIRDSRALKVLVMNVVNQPGETDGYDAADHYRALVEHAGEGLVDVVIVNDPASFSAAAAAKLERRGLAPVAGGGKLPRLGLRLMTRPMASEDDPARHDCAALCAALSGAGDMAAPGGAQERAER